MRTIHKIFSDVSNEIVAAFSQTVLCDYFTNNVDI